MSEELKLYLIITIGNVLKIALFVILAIFFQRWWMALISILFLTGLNKETEK